LQGKRLRPRKGPHKDRCRGKKKQNPPPEENIRRRVKREILLGGGKCPRPKKKRDPSGKSRFYYEGGEKLLALGKKGRAVCKVRGKGRGMSTPPIEEWRAEGGEKVFAGSPPKGSMFLGGERFRGTSEERNRNWGNPLVNREGARREQRKEPLSLKTKAKQPPPPNGPHFKRGREATGGWV